jgi:hypothetical protein
MKQTTTKQLLTFGDGNAKLYGIHTFSISAGRTCPGAKDCFAMAVRRNGKTKLVRGKDCKFTCYQASLESIFPTLFNMAQRNLDLLKAAKTVEAMGQLIHDSLPRQARIIRIHPGGDFFSEEYFMAWINVALNNPNLLMYAYTKSVHIYRKLKHLVPSNLVITASMGGKYDNLITKSMKTCQVVFSPEEAESKGLPIDHDDSHAYSLGIKHFCVLLHGKQQGGSAASEALSALRRRGMGAYNKTEKGYEVAKPIFRMVVGLPSVSRLAA